MVASIGPTTSEELQRRGIRADLEPSHPKMGYLVKEASSKQRNCFAGRGREWPPPVEARQFEEFRTGRSARVCAGGRAHRRRRALDHFEIDPRLGGELPSLPQHRPMSGSRHRPYDMTALAGSGDEQRMNFFRRDSSLAATLANAADLG